MSSSLVRVESWESYQRNRYFYCGSDDSHTETSFPWGEICIITSVYRSRGYCYRYVTMDGREFFSQSSMFGNVRNDDVVTCSECGQVIKAADALADTNHVYCKDCRDTCCICGNIVNKAEAEHTAEGYVCSACESGLRACFICGEQHHYHNMIRCDRHNYCNTCAEEYLDHCSNCGRHIIRGEGNEWRGRTLCDHCYDHRVDDIIWGYHNRPDYSYWANGTATSYAIPSIPYMGVELEVDGEDGNRSVAIKLLEILGENHVYFNNDGSLSDQGFEIITHPHTYEELCALDWDRALEALEQYDYEDENPNAGLHIHISRCAFGYNYDEQKRNLAKLFFFFEKCQKNLRKFARRGDNDYCELTRCGYDPYMTTEELMPKYYNYLEGSHGRYYAINLTNSKTVEFRIFANTLDRDTLLSAFEFVHLICKNAPNIEVADLQKANFDTWTTGRSDRLSEYMSYLDIQPLAYVKPVKFPVGKRIIVKSSSSNPYWGMTGTVCGEATSNGRIPVELDLVDKRLHDCRGQCRPNSGRYFVESELDYSTTKRPRFVIGERVGVMIGLDDDYHRICVSGVVASILYDRDIYAVKFEGEEKDKASSYISLHDCSGRVDNGYGYYLNTCNLYKL